MDGLGRSSPIDSNNVRKRSGVPWSLLEPNRQVRVMVIKEHAVPSDVKASPFPDTFQAQETSETKR